MDADEPVVVDGSTPDGWVPQEPVPLASIQELRRRMQEYSAPLVGPCGGVCIGFDGNGQPVYFHPEG